MRYILKITAVPDQIWRANVLSVHSSRLLFSHLIFLILFLLHCLSSFSNRQPRPATSASPRGYWRVWGALSPASTPTCGLWGRGGRGGSLQWPLLWRRPPLGSQGLFRERFVRGNTAGWGTLFFFLLFFPRYFTHWNAQLNICFYNENN